MDIKDLNKSQLILLAILLSFITSIATGITTVTLMEQAPKAVTIPINRIVRETVDTIAPNEDLNNFQALSEDQQKLLEELKAIKPLTVSLYLENKNTEGEDKLLGTGLFLGNDKIVIASVIALPKEGDVYIVKSVLGEQKVSKVTQEKEFTIIELAKPDTTPVPPKEDPKKDETPKEEVPTTPTQP